MDKTLEVILVAVVLVVAAVILVGLLQGQAGSFGTFADNQTNTASCGISQTQFCGALDSSGSVTPRAQDIYDENNGNCNWASSGASTAAGDC